MVLEVNGQPVLATIPAWQRHIFRFQEHTAALEGERRITESSLKDLQVRLDEAEMNALKNGKKAAAKLESRIHELENELDGEQRRLGDSTKNLRKSERKLKELEFQADEDQKQHNHMQDLVDKLQQKVNWIGQKPFFAILWGLQLAKGQKGH